MKILIKPEHRAAYEDIPNLVGKTHLPMKVFKEWSDSFQVQYGCEYIYKKDCEVVEL